MNIALRTSGGRGEYELAGTQGNITIGNISGKRLIFHFNSQLVIDSGSYCLDPHEVNGQGKPRIRLYDDPSGPKHAYLWLSALLMLPKPIRELNRIPDGPLQIRNDKYVISNIPFAILDDQSDSVVIQPTALELKNKVGKSNISVALRLAQIFEVWREAAKKDDTLAILIKKHREAAFSNPSNHKALIECATTIQRHLQTEGDYLRMLLDNYQIPEIIEPSFELPSENLTESLLVVKRKIAKQWRQVAVRGADAKAFRDDVQAAYDFRCAFTGMRLPQTAITYTSGVDAAHILPWRTYDLNLVQNGLCLSKLCHWAFDNGVIRLDYIPDNSRYRISIPEGIETVAAAHNFDLEYFRTLQGDIPNNRLPSTPGLRPNPEFLKLLNEDLF